MVFWIRESSINEQGQPPARDRFEPDGSLRSPCWRTSGPHRAVRSSCFPVRVRSPKSAYSLAAAVGQPLVWHGRTRSRHHVACHPRNTDLDAGWILSSFGFVIGGFGGRFPGRLLLWLV